LHVTSTSPKCVCPQMHYSLPDHPCPWPPLSLSPRTAFLCCACGACAVRAQFVRSAALFSSTVCVSRVPQFLSQNVNQRGEGSGPVHVQQGEQQGGGGRGGGGHFHQRLQQEQERPLRREENPSRGERLRSGKKGRKPVK